MKNIQSTLLKATILFLVFSFGMFMGEFFQILYTQKDLRDHALASWVKENPQKADLAKKFKEECLIGKKTIAEPKEGDKNTPLPISTIEDCANKNNLGDIYIAIKEADQIFRSTPWPLSYLDINVKIEKK